MPPRFGSPGPAPQTAISPFISSGNTKLHCRPSLARRLLRGAGNGKRNVIGTACPPARARPCESSAGFESLIESSMSRCRISAAVGEIQRVDSQHVRACGSGSIRRCRIVRDHPPQARRDRLKQIIQLQIGHHAVVDLQYQPQTVAFMGQLFLQRQLSS